MSDIRLRTRRRRRGAAVPVHRARDGHQHGLQPLHDARERREPLRPLSSGLCRAPRRDLLRLRRRGAWEQHAIQTSTPGSSFSLRYVVGALTIIGETTARGGVLRVTLDGHARTLQLRSGRLHRRRAIYRGAVRNGVHHLRLAALRGLAALEGLAIASRTL